MKKSTKILSVVLAGALAIGGVVGGSLAWLMDKTDAVTNTFTYGNVDIELAETTGSDYHIVPGKTIAKDPTVTVKADSEASYVFVKVEQANWNDKFAYEIADGWTKLEDVDNVYYRVVAANEEDQEFAVLKDNKVTISADLTKVDVDAAIEGGKVPTLTFTAYAIQQDGTGSVVDAWAKIKA